MFIRGRGLSINATKNEPPRVLMISQYMIVILNQAHIYFRIKEIFPNPGPAALMDKRMNNLVAYVRRVEGDMYDTANSRVRLSQKSTTLLTVF